MAGYGQLVTLYIGLATSGLTVESKPTHSPESICSKYDKSAYSILLFSGIGFRLAGWQDSAEKKSQVFKEVVKNTQATFFIWLMCEKDSIEAKVYWRTTTSSFLRDSGDYLEITMKQAGGGKNWPNYEEQYSTALSLIAPDLKFICLARESLTLNFLVHKNCCVIQTFGPEGDTMKRSLVLIFVKDFVYSERHELVNETKPLLHWEDPGVEFKFNELPEVDLEHEVLLTPPKENDCLSHVANKPGIRWIRLVIGIGIAVLIGGVCLWYGFCRDSNDDSI